MRCILQSEFGSHHDVDTKGATHQIPEWPHKVEVNEKQLDMSKRSSEDSVDTTLDRSAWHREVTINRLEGMSFVLKKLVRVSAGILRTLTAAPCSGQCSRLGSTDVPHIKIKI